MKKGKLTKSQQNKEVRAIFNRFGVDTSALQFSTSGSRISLYGVLVRRSGEEFTFEILSNLLNELQRVGQVNSELLNWDLNCGVRRKEKSQEDSFDEYEEEYDYVA